MKLPSLDDLQKQLSAVAVKTTEHAINSGMPSIAKIRKNYGDVEAKAIIVDMIVNFVSFINLGKTMNAEQIAETVKLIQSYFPHLNLADFKLFFEKMKMGHYGKFYDRMDGQIILEKMEEYSQDRMNAFEQIRLQQHRQAVKENPIGSGYHPDVIEAIKKAMGEKTQKPSAPKTERLLSDVEILHQRILRQFDNLFIRFGQNNGLRTLKIGQSLFTIDKFIEQKIKNYENIRNRS